MAHVRIASRHRHIDLRHAEDHNGHPDYARKTMADRRQVVLPVLLRLSQRPMDFQDRTQMAFTVANRQPSTRECYL